MSSNAPMMRDASGWPVPTYALMDGMSCYDPVGRTVWTAHELRFRDGRQVRHEGLICDHRGWARRADAPVPGEPATAPPPVEPSRPPSVDVPAQPALDTVR